MSKPTKEELTDNLRYSLMLYSYNYLIEKPRYSDIYSYNCGDIAKLRNPTAESRESRDAWNKWMGRIKDDYNLGPMHIIYLVKAMLEALGYEVEED